VYLVCVIDCCTREIVGWNLSHRCRTEDALAAVEQAVLERLPSGSREENLTVTTNNGTQFTSSRFLETLRRLGIMHRRTAYHHPEGNSYIERLHRNLKEEEVWTAEYRSLEEARTSIARWIEEYNHDRPHRGVRNRTPHATFLVFAGVLKNGLVGEICGSLIRSNGGRELGSSSPRTRCGIARLQRFAFVASCPSNQFALSDKCYAVLQESSAPRADEHAIWDTLRSPKPGSLRAMPSQFETSCAI
jgi:hypothetical protein